MSLVSPQKRGFPIITPSKVYILNNKFLPSFIGVSSLNIHESLSATFGRLWSLWITGPKKARLQHSRPVWCIKGLIFIVNMLLLLTSVQALLISSVSSHSNLWWWRMIFGTALRGGAGFQGRTLRFQGPKKHVFSTLDQRYLWKVLIFSSTCYYYLLQLIPSPAENLLHVPWRNATFY